MASGNVCIGIPAAPNGEPSQAYRELRDKIADRKIVNYIYACYLNNGVAAQMSAQGMAMNSQGEHSGSDILKYFEYSDVLSKEITDLYKAKKLVGAIDNGGDTILYDEAMTPLRQVDSYNDSHDGTVASIYQQGGKFHISVVAKDSTSFFRKARVKEQLKGWETVVNDFKTYGIDLNNAELQRLCFNIANPLKTRSFLQNLSLMQQALSYNIIQRNDLNLLFSMGEQTGALNGNMRTHFNNAAGRRLSVEELAEKAFDTLQSTTTPANLVRWIETTINKCLQYNGADLSAIISHYYQETNDVITNSDESDIQTTLDDLNNKHGILEEEVHIKDSDAKLETLRDVLLESIVTLNREIADLRRTKGIKLSPLNDSVEYIMDKIKKEQYSLGAIEYLKNAINTINELDTLLKNVSTTGTVLENAISASEAIIEMQRRLDGYYTTICALANLDILNIDENITDTVKESIETEAKKVKKFYDSKRKVIAEMQKSLMLDVATEVLGNELPNGIAVANALSIAEKDLGFTDYLYALSRVSRPLPAAVGKIIEDAQDERGKMLSDIALRIRRETSALYDAGHNSRFMYDSDGRIISDIHWDAYYKARGKAIGRFKSAGMKGLDLKKAIESWENKNTEDRVVDTVSGRTERVPNNKYRKRFPRLTPAQQRYYDAMMQIKGEMGSYLPPYAQQHYRPPQLFRSMWDAIVDAKSAKDVAKAVWRKIESIWKAREDDTFYHQNGIIIEDIDYNVSEADFNNNPLKRIPIFYCNNLKNQEELMLDFSAAIQAFAGTAINFHQMNKVKNLVETMADYTMKLPVLARHNGVPVVEQVYKAGISIMKRVFKMNGNTNTVAILQGMIDQHLYGVSIKDTGKWVQVARSILAYHSMKGLSLNVKGMISNYISGVIQTIIEAGGGEFYNFKDLAWAMGMIFGTPAQLGRITGVMFRDKTSKEYLLTEFFDIEQDAFQKLSHTRYHTNVFRQLLSGDFTFLGYESGEYLLHLTGMYATLHHVKVRVDGKKMTLFDAITTTPIVDGNCSLTFKGNHIVDMQGNTVNMEWLKKIKSRVKYVNQSCFGAMNSEQKGYIHQYLAGRYVMNFRQWMVEHYSRRFRGKHYDGTLNEFREGYYRTAAAFALNYVKGVLGFAVDANLRWSNLTPQQKANIRRCLTEQVIFACLTSLDFMLGDPDAYRRDWWGRMWMYQLKRMRLEVSASTPWGALPELKTTINSPMSAVNTINGFFYPIYGLPDIDETYDKRTRYWGYNKYLINLGRYTLPFWKDIEQIIYLDEDESIFRLFDNSRVYR